MTDDEITPTDSGAPKGRVVMSWRVEAEFREWLKMKAAANRRSVLKEVEARLLESRTIEQDLGGPRLLALFKELVADARVRHGDSDSWLDDAREYHRMVRAWERLLTSLGPQRPKEIVLRLPMTPQALRDAQELFERYVPGGMSWWESDTASKGFGAIDDDPLPDEPRPHKE
jgi:hypothetical protein